MVPFPEVPYVRELGRRALAAIPQNLARGFRSQREANDAALLGPPDLDSP